MNKLRTFAVMTVLAVVAFSMTLAPSAMAAKTKHAKKHAKKQANAQQQETEKKS